MITSTFPYKDFDGDEQTATVHFNLSKPDLAEHLDLEDRFQAVLDMLAKVKKDDRNLTRDEIQLYLDLVKYVMEIGFGVKSEDGRHFRKSPETWEDFRYSAAYDEYIWSLFQDPEKANEFLLGVLPQDLRLEAEAQARAELEKSDTSIADASEGLSEADKALLEMDPQKMTPEQLQRAYSLRFSGKA